MSSNLTPSAKPFISMNNGLRIAVSLFLLHASASSPDLWAKKDAKVTLQTDFLAFSPNKDGVQDQVTFRPIVENVKAVGTWELQLRDALGMIRRTFSGSKNLPESIPWNGTDDFGAPCAEGSYQVLFSLWDSKHRQKDAPSLSIALDLTPPTISLSSEEKSAQLKDELLLLPTFYLSAVDLSGIHSWKLKLQDEKKQELYFQAGKETIPSSYQIPPLTVSPSPEKLTLIFSVMDTAGNSGDSAPLDFPVKKEVTKKLSETLSSSPLATAKTKNLPKEKELEGRFLQMTAILFISDLFGANAVFGTPLVSQSRTLLNPVAKTLLDSPGARATILGHVDATKSAEDDRALSSYFAWRVYSYLVKEMGVDRDAVTVKGLGSSAPIAENRTPLGRARNRRIEIQFFLPSQP